jgi:hypothetical protein
MQDLRALDNRTCVALMCQWYAQVNLAFIVTWLRFLPPGFLTKLNTGDLSIQDMMMMSTEIKKMDPKNPCSRVFDQVHKYSLLRISEAEDWKNEMIASKAGEESVRECLLGLKEASGLDLNDSETDFYKKKNEHCSLELSSKELQNRAEIEMAIFFSYTWYLHTIRVIKNVLYIDGIRDLSQYYSKTIGSFFALTGYDKNCLKHMLNLQTRRVRINKIHVLNNPAWQNQLTRFIFDYAMQRSQMFEDVVLNNVLVSE